MLLRAARARAAKKGLPFSITEDDIIIPTFCPVLGVRLERSLGSKGPGPYSPTLDRLECSLGYVPGNVIVISNRANLAKSDLSVEEIEAVLNFCRANQRKE